MSRYRHRIPSYSATEKPEQDVRQSAALSVIAPYHAPRGFDVPAVPSTRYCKRSFGFARLLAFHVTAGQTMTAPAMPKFSRTAVMATAKPSKTRRSCCIGIGGAFGISPLRAALSDEHTHSWSTQGRIRVLISHRSLVFLNILLTNASTLCSLIYRLHNVDRRLHLWQKSN